MYHPFIYENIVILCAADVKGNLISYQYFTEYTRVLYKPIKYPTLKRIKLTELTASVNWRSHILRTLVSSLCFQH